MEDWQLDFEWLQVQHFVRDMMGRKNLPDLQAILFLIGIQESGRVAEKYSKEEKQDLMHVAVCSLLEGDGYYEFQGRDQDGWPHFRQIRKVRITGVDEQEKRLKEKVIEYFRSSIDQHTKQVG